MGRWGRGGGRWASGGVHKKNLKIHLQGKISRKTLHITVDG